jgi:hypothetical protein
MRVAIPSCRIAAPVVLKRQSRNVEPTKHGKKPFDIMAIYFNLVRLAGHTDLPQLRRQPELASQTASKRPAYRITGSSLDR